MAVSDKAGWVVALVILGFEFRLKYYGFINWEKLSSFVSCFSEMFDFVQFCIACVI